MCHHGEMFYCSWKYHKSRLVLVGGPKFQTQCRRIPCARLGGLVAIINIQQPFGFSKIKLATKIQDKCFLNLSRDK